MKITVIGATGMVGSCLVAEATARGHAVVAAARRPGTYPNAGTARSAHVDVTAPETLGAVLADADVAILTVRPAPGAEHTLAPMTSTVLGAAASAGVPLLVIGGAGPLHSPTTPGVFVADDPDYVPAAWHALAAASTAQLRVCQQHPSARWTYLSPPAILEPGERTGRYRRGTTTLLTAPDGTSRISAEDFAIAAIDEIERPGPHRHITAAW